MTVKIDAVVRMEIKKEGANATLSEASIQLLKTFKKLGGFATGCIYGELISLCCGRSTPYFRTVMNQVELDSGRQVCTIFAKFIEDQLPIIIGFMQDGRGRVSVRIARLLRIEAANYYPPSESWDNPPDAVKNLCLYFCRSYFKTIIYDHRDDPRLWTDIAKAAGHKNRSGCGGNIKNPAFTRFMSRLGRIIAFTRARRSGVTEEEWENGVAWHTLTAIKHNSGLFFSAQDGARWAFWDTEKAFKVAAKASADGDLEGVVVQLHKAEKAAKVARASSVHIAAMAAVTIKAADDADVMIDGIKALENGFKKAQLKAKTEAEEAVKRAEEDKKLEQVFQLSSSDQGSGDIRRDLARETIDKDKRIAELEAENVKLRGG